MLRVPDPDPKEISSLRRPFPDRFTLLAIQAADAALADAQLDPRSVDSDRAGVLVNSSYGPSTTVEGYLRVLFSEGPAKASAIGFARSVANAVLGELTRRYGFRGPSTMTVSGSLLGYAFDLIRSGSADLLLCVGVDILGDNTPWYYRQAGLLNDGLVLGEPAPPSSSKRDRTPRCGVRRKQRSSSSTPRAFVPKPCSGLRIFRPMRLPRCSRRCWIALGPTPAPSTSSPRSTMVIVRWRKRRSAPFTRAAWPTPTSFGRSARSANVLGHRSC